MRRLQVMPASQRITDSFLVPVGGADLAFDPNQPRDLEGQWVDVADLLKMKSYEGQSYVGYGATVADRIAQIKKGDNEAGDGGAWIRKNWDDIKDKPVRLLNNGTFADGHHRVMVAQERGVKRLPVTYKKYETDLAFDPNQPRDAKGQWTASAANVVSMWKQTTPGEREAGEQWYPLAHQTALALSKKYGVTKEEAAGLLAAYSPQTPWGRDQVEASESLRYGHGVGGKHGAVWFTHDDPRVEDRVGVMATGQTRKLADDIMAGGDFDTLTAGRNKDGSLKPASPKIRAFYHLIAAGGQDDPNNPRVVIDRHAMSVAYGQRVTNDDYTRMRPGSAKKYKPFVDAYVDAARQISAMEGRTISPETVQAATWLAQQRQNAAMTNQVGKTRKALGNKDWNEWTQYAARYLGLDTAGGAKVGYSDLARAMRDHVIDLSYTGQIDLDHFNPLQPRDNNGRWTDKPGAHLPGAVKPVYPSEIEPEPYAGPISENDDGQPKPSASEHTSWVQQNAAQQQAQAYNDANSSGWTGEVVGTNPPLRVWQDYQMPGKYGTINKHLRKGDDKTLLKHAQQMFSSPLAYTTTHKMTVYRALRDDKTHDWANTLTPGSTFEEDGIVSSTTYRRLAQGWLGLAGKRNGEAEDVSKIQADDVVMEVQVPKGSKIVGGTTQFIETMLPPHTKFKVISSKHLMTPNAIDPLTGDEVAPFVYTHVVVEAILPEEVH